jgi:ATP-dependent DNA helicase RecG
MRPERLNPLFAAVTSLAGVGPGVARPLRRLGIERVLDACFHLPAGRIERTPVHGLHPSLEGRVITVELLVEAHVPGRGRAPFRARCRDPRGLPVELVWFGAAGAWAARQAPVGTLRVVAGRLERFGEGFRIAHPDHVVPPERADTIPLTEPVYPLSEGLTNRRMAAIVAAALERAPNLPEWSETAATRGWPAWRAALDAAHRLDPIAHMRLAHDELLASQLALQLLRARTRRRTAPALVGDGARVEAALAALPYAPTGAQRRAIAAIHADLARPVPMLRLLQGDVGAGKTLVALAAMLRAVEAGHQAALLAPTELLARQHHESLTRMAAGQARIACLTGRDSSAARREILAGLAEGAIDIAVGTHALFQADVAFASLALVVIDEQHRFGVEERKALMDKGRAPHLLAMTATPIPRTLALTAHGELDASKLDELPPGRQPVETRVIAPDRFEELLAGLGRHLATGARAYWVCPLVEGAEAEDEAAAQARHAMLARRFGAERVALVHGRMKPAEKDAAMARFTSGPAQLLVATTVIEVGVDVPSATLIIIEAAERFGLAQLHQLRGRVGRGGGRSLCLLLRGEQLTETARARLKLLRETSDGFRIAEEDLRLRGPGEMLGTRQAGEPAFRLATPAHVAELVEAAHAEARALVEADPELATPRGEAARMLLYLFERDTAVRLLRSG